VQNSFDLTLHEAQQPFKNDNRKNEKAEPDSDQNFEQLQFSQLMKRKN